MTTPSFAPTVRTVRTYLAVPGSVAVLAPIFARGAATLLTARLRRLLEARIDASAAGPGEERRDAPWWVLARVRAAGGKGSSSSLTARTLRPPPKRTSGRRSLAGVREARPPGFFIRSVARQRQAEQEVL